MAWSCVHHMVRIQLVKGGFNLLGYIACNAILGALSCCSPTEEPLCKARFARPTCITLPLIICWDRYHAWDGRNGMSVQASVPVHLFDDAVIGPVRQGYFHARGEWAAGHLGG